MKKKLIIPSALSLLALVGVTAGCGSKENLDAMVRIYGGDRLDYVVKQDGKETKNIQFGKDLEITFTPKVDMTVGETKLHFASLDGIDLPSHKDEKEGKEIDEPAAEPFVGYGNKVYHPFEYRLTKDVSYFWTRQDNGEGNPASYVLKVPAANFKKNIIIAFDESIWLPEIVLDSQNQFKKLGVTYPYFDTAYMKMALAKVLGDDYTIPESIETYHCVNEYNLNDVIEDPDTDPYLNKALWEPEEEALKESKTFLERASKDDAYPYDNYNLCESGITYAFELTGNYYFGTLSKLGVTNFEFALTKEVEGKEVVDTFGGQDDNPNKITVSTLNNYAFVTFDWATLYNYDSTAKKLVPNYKKIECKKAESNINCDVIVTNEGRKSGKPEIWGEGTVNYLQSHYDEMESEMFVYKDKLSVAMPPIVNYYVAPKYIRKDGDNYIFPNITMTFSKDKETKVYNFGDVETQKVDFTSAFSEGFLRSYYKELPDTNWCITIVEGYLDAERKGECQLLGMFFGSKSTTSFIQPGKTSFADTVTITLPDA